MKKTGLANSLGPHGASERSSYHHPSASAQDRRCDNCKYRVQMNECQQFKCKDCGTYIVSIALLKFEQICDYCYEEYMEKEEMSDYQYDDNGQLVERKKG